MAIKHMSKWTKGSTDLKKNVLQTCVNTSKFQFKVYVKWNLKIKFTSWSSYNFVNLTPKMDFSTPITPEPMFERLPVLENNYINFKKRVSKISL